MRDARWEFQESRSTDSKTLTDLSVAVACQPVALHRAFRNLLENAAAHGVRKRSVERGDADEEDDGNSAFCWAEPAFAHRLLITA